MSRNYDAEFVICMKGVCDVYQVPYGPLYTVVCMYESPKLLIGEATVLVPLSAGSIEKFADEYVRLGAAELFLAVDTLTRKMTVAVESKRFKKDWAEFIRNLVDVRYPLTEKVVLIMDNLNTYKISPLYEAFEPEEAHRLQDRLEIHFTPKHGSWFNVPRMEFSI